MTRILLTGGNGFVGSHILDRLRKEGVAVRLLLRKGSDTAFIREHLGQVEVHPGSVTDPASLAGALEGVSHVVHCAGKTKALRVEEYYEVNAEGTRNLLRAMRDAGCVKRLVLVSSLAVSGPGTAAAPAREDASPRPVTEYGRSKLAGEEIVRQECPCPFVILRPGAVYGPRDRDVLVSIKLLRGPIRPSFGNDGQELSFICAPDVAGATWAALQAKQAEGGTFHLAAPEVLTLGGVTAEIARQLGSAPKALPLPRGILYLACAAQGAIAKWTGRPHILSREKYPELAAPGWVCDVSRAREQLGFVAGTTFAEGLKTTLAWYRREGWL